MKVIHSDHFRKNFKDFPPDIQRKFGKQVTYLLRDIRTPRCTLKNMMNQTVSGKHGLIKISASILLLKTIRTSS